MSILEGHSNCSIVIDHLCLGPVPKRSWDRSRRGLRTGPKDVLGPVPKRSWDRFFLLVYYDILWYIKVYYGILWYIKVYYGVLLYIMVYCDISWYIMVYYDILWFIMVYNHILWEVLGPVPKRSWDRSFSLMWICLQLPIYDFIWPGHTLSILTY